eukprot:285303-Chlamydomonas_euryale.AAC.1
MRMPCCAHTCQRCHRSVKVLVAFADALVVCGHVGRQVAAVVYHARILALLHTGRAGLAELRKNVHGR